MADIFGNVTPPAWLQRLTIPETQGETGTILGTALGGGLLALQQDPSTIDPATGQTKIDPDTGKPLTWFETRKGLKQGLAEARLNQQDPQWKLKEKQLEASVVGNYARAASAWQQVDAQNRDLAIWTTQDLPALQKWQDELKTNPDATPPVMKSTQGQRVSGQIEQQLLRRDTLKFRQQMQKDQFDLNTKKYEVTAANSRQFWKDLESVDSQADVTAILGTIKNGVPTEESWGLLSNAPKKKTAQEKAAELRGEQERLTEAEKQKGRLELSGQKAKEKEEFEQQRQQDRLSLEEARSKYRVDIEKMRLDAKNTQGKVITEDEFVNRHFTAVFNALVKESGKPEEAARDSGRILRARYRAEHKKAPETAPAAPAPATTTKAPSGTNEDPLGILK